VLHWGCLWSPSWWDWAGTQSDWTHAPKHHATPPCDGWCQKCSLEPLFEGAASKGGRPDQTTRFAGC
jgi:hypothetical protein